MISAVLKPVIDTSRRSFDFISVSSSNAPRPSVAVPPMKLSPEKSRHDAPTTEVESLSEYITPLIVRADKVIEEKVATATIDGKTTDLNMCILQSINS
ncbi:hypothetical protein ED352_00255 [Muribaculaceae bacterium Isolate-002 (NCI)]|nr:hypothetical protein ED352_00255 [Muribaculaceae bacterium Isolate-002 (NCI)]